MKGSYLGFVGLLGLSGLFGLAGEPALFSLFSLFALFALFRIGAKQSHTSPSIESVVDFLNQEFPRCPQPLLESLAPELNDLHQIKQSVQQKVNAYQEEFGPLVAPEGNGAVVYSANRAAIIVPVGSNGVTLKVVLL